MRSRSPIKSYSGWFSSPILWVALAILVTFIWCEFTWVRPLREQLANKEKSIHEWERINRQERDAIAAIKTISVAELQKWVATVDEQNRLFAGLQNKFHQQEVDLAGPATSYLVVGGFITLASIGFVVFWLRDADAKDATTLENVAALAPDDMMRSILVAGLTSREPINLIVESKPSATALPAVQNRFALPNGDSTGEVIQFFAEKGFGFILPDTESDKVYFNLSEVMATDRQTITCGTRVVYRKRIGKKGPKAISVRCR